MNEPTNSETSVLSKHPMGTSKSSLPNFFNQELLLLNDKRLRACIIIDTFASEIEKFSISKVVNLYWSFFGIVLYHSITDVEFFHWFILVKETILVIILSNMVLLIFPMSGFDEFINLHDILFGKSSLWSLMVIYDSLSYILCGRLLKVVLLLTLFRYWCRKLFSCLSFCMSS